MQQQGRVNKTSENQKGTTQQHVKGHSGMEGLKQNSKMKEL